MAKTNDFVQMGQDKMAQGFRVLVDLSTESLMKVNCDLCLLKGMEDLQLPLGDLLGVSFLGLKNSIDFSYYCLGFL